MRKILLGFILSLSFLNLAFAANFGADRHMSKGINCQSCHGANKEIESPAIQQCKVCHNPAQLAKKTEKVKPHNPHISPHYNTDLDCVLCHVQHAEPENYCAQCHQFNFKVK